MCTRIFKPLLVTIVMATFAFSTDKITSPVKTDFATYYPREINLTAKANENDFTISSDFSNIENWADSGLSSEEKKLLSQNGFVVSPAKEGFANFSDLYNVLKNEKNLYFITTDAMLHSFHILYDYSLRDMETNHFFEDLKAVDEALYDFMVYEFSYNSYSTETIIRDALRLNMAYFGVALKELDSTFIPLKEVDSLVNAECTLMKNHEGISRSPIFGIDEDYSQYVPRGHYTRTQLLSSYFKAMMWHGRMQFRADTTIDNIDNLMLPTLQALIICQALVLTQPYESFLPCSSACNSLSFWSRIYEPTVFFVGKSDDINPSQYIKLAESVYGDLIERMSIAYLADSTLLRKFICAVNGLATPKICSDNGINFRFMGQRFIPDSYVLDQLVYDRISDRMMPKGLDVFSAMGSDRALSILTGRYNEDRFGGYLAKMDSLRSYFNSLPASQWAENLYWNWLYTLQPLIEPKDNKYPPFMRTIAYQDKTLTTASGSWAELRHDTILYAKQSYGTSGFPPLLQTTYGYVEPQPECFARIASLARFMRDGLVDRDIISEQILSKLESLERTSAALQSIAEKELNHEQLTLTEVNIINGFPVVLKDLNDFNAFSATNEADSSMAVIADVHTDPNAGEVLEVGCGRPWKMNVVVKMNGKLYLATGGVFSYYEFTHPMSDRLTDEAWQDTLANNKPPMAVDWADTYVSTLLDDAKGFNNYDLIGRIDTFTIVPDIYNQTMVENLPESNDMVATSVYPNPSNPQVAISFDNPTRNAVACIYNLNGQLVKNLGNVKSSNIAINVSLMPSGTYVCKITTGRKQLIKRFVVNK